MNLSGGFPATMWFSLPDYTRRRRSKNIGECKGEKKVKDTKGLSQCPIIAYGRWSTVNTPRRGALLSSIFQNKKATPLMVGRKFVFHGFAFIFNAQCNFYCLGVVDACWLFDNLIYFQLHIANFWWYWMKLL